MDKLEKGMYVRTEYGIGKYKKDYTNSQDLTWRVVEGCLNTSNQEDWQDLFSDSEIIKASFDIIDLIKPGDYVNGKKVIVSGYNIFDEWCVTVESKDDLDDYIYPKEIKSIVTKEQFESMSYKLEE